MNIDQAHKQLSHPSKERDLLAAGYSWTTCNVCKGHTRLKHMIGAKVIGIYTCEKCSGTGKLWIPPNKETFTK